MHTSNKTAEPSSKDIIDLSTRLSEREQLRAEARLAMSGELTNMDLGMLTLAGLVGVLPALPLGALPESLSVFVHLAERGRGVALGASGNLTALDLPLDQALDLALEHCPDELGWLKMFLNDGGSNTLANFTPSLEEIPAFSEALSLIHGTNMTAVTALTDAWCENRGLQHDGQTYHEFHALSHGLGACVSAFCQPDPLLIGKAGYHIFKALQASRRLTDTLTRLVEVAAEESAQANLAYDNEVARSDRSRLSSLAALDIGDAGDANALFPVTKSKKRW